MDHRRLDKGYRTSWDSDREPWDLGLTPMIRDQDRSRRLGWMSTDRRCRTGPRPSWRGYWSLDRLEMSGYLQIGKIFYLKLYNLNNICWYLQVYIRNQYDITYFLGLRKEFHSFIYILWKCNIILIKHKNSTKRMSHVRRESSQCSLVFRLLFFKCSTSCDWRRRIT